MEYKQSFVKKGAVRLSACIAELDKDNPTSKTHTSQSDQPEQIPKCTTNTLLVEFTEEMNNTWEEF
jgi:hypothetical protein